MYYSDYDFFRASALLIICFIIFLWGFLLFINFYITIKMRFKRKLTMD